MLTVVPDPPIDEGRRAAARVVADAYVRALSLVHPDDAEELQYYRGRARDAAIVAGQAPVRRVAASGAEVLAEVSDLLAARVPQLSADDPTREVLSDILPDLDALLGRRQAMRGAAR